MKKAISSINKPLIVFILILTLGAYIIFTDVVQHTKLEHSISKNANSSTELLVNIENYIAYLENRINTHTANEKDLKIAVENLKNIKEKLSQQNNLSSSQSYIKAQIAIDKAISILPLGEAFHNIPIEMVAGNTTIIEAGIGNNIKKEVQKELVGNGKVQINKKVHFNPFGVKMFLDVNKEDFKVRLLSDEEQQITSKEPSIWRWEVTPLKAGQHLILVKATVEIKVPELDIVTKKTVEVFKAKRKVNVNWQYSVYQFITQNWKEATGLIFGTGSLAAFINWWLAKKEKREKVSS